jgi:nifR3 family TIM-barrel protein
MCVCTKALDNIMVQDFWRTLPTPFFALAPLANVTDAAFRRIVATYGKPDVIWSEFTSAAAICAAPGDTAWRNLLYTEAERPIVAQLWGADPVVMERAAAVVAALGFDGLDLNMGCPDRTVEKRGAGAVLCQHPARAKDLIRAAKRGAGALPISVKIRIGYERNAIETWLPSLLEAEPAAITIHARTRQEKSDAPARWDVVARAVAIRHSLGSATLIIGNGDVRDLTEARQKARRTGVDGVMLGRAIFGNPWLFHPYVRRDTLPIAARLRVLVEHALLFERLLGDVKPLAHMKKHYKAYVSGWAGAEDLRTRLMATHTAADLAAACDTYVASAD